MPTNFMHRSHARRESWPPTTIRLPPQLASSQSEQHEAELSKVDEDPLTYFLTPAPAVDDDVMDVDFDMVFDAGIEDPKNPPPIVRSISPSNLAGLTRRASPRLLTPPRTPSPRLLPDLDMSASSVEDADEHEDYVRFTSSTRNDAGLPLSLRDFSDSIGARHSMSPRPRSPLSAATSPGARGRAAHYFAPRTATRPSLGRNFSSSRSPLHSWLPSPDVFSIQEETDESLDAGKANSSPSLETGNQRTKPIDIPAAKPKKRVRFNLTPETI